MKVIENAPTVAFNADRVVGQFVSYELKDGYKVKRINLQTATGLCSLKLTKTARASLFRLSLERPIQPGVWLELAVQPKWDAGDVKYKVWDVQVVTEAAAMVLAQSTASVSPLPKAKQPTVIQVCDRGTCRKRGAATIMAVLQSAIHDQELASQIVVRSTGCLKNCKHGPNLAIGKACHGDLCPTQAIDLLATLC